MSVAREHMKRRRLLTALLAALALAIFAPRPGQNATSAEKELPKEITNSVGIKLKLIPAGRFMMGSPEKEPGHLDREGPRSRSRSGPASPWVRSTVAESSCP